MSDAQTPAFDARETVEITLAFPITVDGRKIDKVTMRRPKLRDTRAARKVTKDQFEAGVWMLATLCDLPPEVLDEMDDIDAARLQAQYDSFRGQPAE